LGLNVIVWGVMVVSYLVGIRAEGGPYSGLGAIMLCLLAALLGAGANAVLCLLKLGQGHRYQAVLYFIGLIPLAAVFLMLGNALSHIGKIGG
jgi:hypothetical protein